MSAERRSRINDEKYVTKAVLKKNDTVSVCLAEHRKLGQLRIVKTVSARSENAKELYREALLTQQLQHPCIPIIFDIEEQADGFSVIEEYIPGVSLSSYIQKNHLSIPEILNFSIQICDLLVYLHGRTPAVYHLDLKPDNLIVFEDKVYLIDFGSAKSEEEIKKNPMLTGTPGYAAPECYHGYAEAGSDLYSVGKMMEKMLAACIPIRKQARKRAQIQEICKRLTNEKKAERFISAAKLKEKLERMLRKEKSKGKKNCVVIALAGSGRRVGVTRVSMWYTAYLCKRGFRAIYLECNASSVVQQFDGLSGGAKRSEKTGRIPMAEARGNMEIETGSNQYGLLWEKAYYEEIGYEVILADFGVLTTENRGMFLEADYQILFSGGRFWEEENLWRVLGLLSGSKKREMVLFSFLNRKEVGLWSKRLLDKPCRGIPFIAKTGCGKEWKQLLDLFDELTDLWEADTVK